MNVNEQDELDKRGGNNYLFTRGSRSRDMPKVVSAIPRRELFIKYRN
jgi:hypothetical protein